MSDKITGISAAVIEALQAAPLTFAELFGAVQKRIPAITEKKLRDNLYVMASSMKIAHQGEGAARLYSAVAKPKASPPPKAAASEAKAAPAAKKPRNKKPRPAALPAVITGSTSAGSYVFGVNRLDGGGMQIHKNGATLEFTAHEVRTILEHAPQ